MHGRSSVLWISGLALVAALTLVVSGCGGREESTSTTVTPERKLQVVTTTPVLADFARVIGGDEVDVYDIVKPNADPHDYETSPSDITALAKADVIIKNGVGLEKWLDKTLDNAEVHASVIDASANVVLRYENGDKKKPDPHIWHSPVNAKTMVANIRAGLVAADPKNMAIYESQERSYDAQLDGLDSEIKNSIATLSNKSLVTNHDSLGYYVDEFGLDFVGAVIPSFDSQAELSPAQINDLVAKVKAHNVKAIFAESSLPAKSAETIAQEAKVKVVSGDDALYGDSMGLSGSGADTYLNMERHNTNVIVANLR